MENDSSGSCTLCLDGIDGHDRSTLGSKAKKAFKFSRRKKFCMEVYAPHCRHLLRPYCVPETSLGTLCVSVHSLIPEHATIISHCTDEKLRYKRINSTKVTCLLRLIPSNPGSSAWDPTSVRHWSPRSLHHMLPHPWDHILPKEQRSLRKWGVGEPGGPRTPCMGWTQGRQGPQLWQPLNNCSDWVWHKARACSLLQFHCHFKSTRPPAKQH